MEGYGIEWKFIDTIFHHDIVAPHAIGGHMTEDKVVRLIDREVIKHSSAVQVQGSVGLLARRAWNVMLAHAYDDLPKKEEFSISIRDLSSALEFGSNDTEVLKSAIRDMFGAYVEWDLLGKEGGGWGAMTLLSRAKIDRGLVTYAYDSKLREMLHNPRMYARIKLSLQNTFKSKYSLILYELMLDYFDAGRQTGETPWISLEQIRKLMGVGESQYPEFKDLGRYVIGSAVTEVSNLTELTVEVQYQRERRKIAAVKFTARPHPGKKPKIKIPSSKPSKGKPKKNQMDPRVSEYRGPVDRGIGIGW